MRKQFIIITDMELGDTLINSNRITYAYELPPEDGTSWITRVQMSDGSHFTVSQSIEEIFHLAYEQ
jgi:hypothetical protein